MSLYDTENIGNGIIGYFAQYMGASEAAFKLLLSLLAGYPLALIHRHLLFGKAPTLQHLYIIICGIGIGYFNYGTAIVHSLASVLAVYVLLLVCGGTVFSVVLSFIFMMSYLIIGYYSTGTENYDITWSMPHCVLTLRLIGLSIDVYDGRKKVEKLSVDQKKTALQKLPNILEVAGHSYFFGGFLVGPQFPMRRYLDFTHGAYASKNGGKPNCVRPGMIRFGLGFTYMCIFHFGSLLIPERYVLSDEYNALPFWKRSYTMTLWGKIALYKYIASWLLSEGSCIMAGLTFNGKDENGEELWDGCANVKVWGYETGVTFDKLIKTFNVNTNLWVAHYVFKRLKFLGNKLLSQGISLLFLAVWHGLHSGYYMTFFMEFIVMKMEREFIGLLDRLKFFRDLNNNPIAKIPLWIVCKYYQLFMFAWCITPFILLSFSRWFQVYSSVYFAGFVIYLGWPAVYPVLKSLVGNSRLDTKATNGAAQ